MSSKTINEVQADLDRYKQSAPLCDKHISSTGARSGCPYCAITSLYAALSRISYVLGEPNEMEMSEFDCAPDEEAVVRQAEKFCTAARKTSASLLTLQEDREFAWRNAHTIDDARVKAEARVADLEAANASLTMRIVELESSLNATPTPFDRQRWMNEANREWQLHKTPHEMFFAGAELAWKEARSSASPFLDPQRTDPETLCMNGTDACAFVALDADREMLDWFESRQLMLAYNKWQKAWCVFQSSEQTVPNDSFKPTVREAIRWAMEQELP